MNTAKELIFSELKKIFEWELLVNPSNAEAILSSKAQGHKYFWKPSKPCHIGIYWIALVEYSRMSTHMPGFQSFSGFLHYFVLAKLATSSLTVKFRWTFLLLIFFQTRLLSVNFHWNCQVFEAATGMNGLTHKYFVAFLVYVQAAGKCGAWDKLLDLHWLLVLGYRSKQLTLPGQCRGYIFIQSTRMLIFLKNI